MGDLGTAIIACTHFPGRSPCDQIPLPGPLPLPDDLFTGNRGELARHGDRSRSTRIASSHRASVHSLLRRVDFALPPIRSTHTATGDRAFRGRGGMNRYWRRNRESSSWVFAHGCTASRHNWSYPTTTRCADKTRAADRGASRRNWPCGRDPRSSRRKHPSPRCLHTASRFAYRDRTALVRRRDRVRKTIQNLGGPDAFDRLEDSLAGIFPNGFRATSCTHDVIRSGQTRITRTQESWNCRPHPRSPLIGSIGNMSGICFRLQRVFESRHPQPRE